MYFPTGRPLVLGTFGLLVLSLWGTVTNAVPLSVVFVLLAPIVPYALTRTASVPRVVAVLLVVYISFIASTLVYAPLSFVDPSFYRRDGNFFVTFLPVLIGGVINLQIDVRRLVAAFLVWSTVFVSLMLVVFLATGGTLVYHEPGVFHSLFEAHNAAGGFLAMMVALLFGYLIQARRKGWPLVALAIHAAALYLTVSRGSMLAILLAVLLILVMRGRFLKLTIASMALLTGVALAYAYPLWVDAGSPWSIFLGEVEGLGSAQAGGVDSNITDRLLYLWPRALYVFLQSPIVGAGYGSFNDLPYTFAGIPHLIVINKPLELVFSSSHAHNTYLHVLAETGLIGLVLLCLLLQAIWRFIKTMPSGLREGMLIAFWVAVFSASTEHRLFTPSQMLPFTIILGLSLANARWQARSIP